MAAKNYMKTTAVSEDYFERAVIKVPDFVVFVSVANSQYMSNS